MSTMMCRARGNKTRALWTHRIAAGAAAVALILAGSASVAFADEGAGGGDKGGLPTGDGSLLSVHSRFYDHTRGGKDGPVYLQGTGLNSLDYILEHKTSSYDKNVHKGGTTYESLKTSCTSALAKATARGKAKWPDAPSGAIKSRVTGIMWFGFNGSPWQSGFGNRSYFDDEVREWAGIAKGVDPYSVKDSDLKNSNPNNFKGFYDYMGPGYSTEDRAKGTGGSRKAEFLASTIAWANEGIEEGLSGQGMIRSACIAANSFEPPVDVSFQPTVTTKAAAGVVNKGDVLADRVTVGVAKGDTWPEGAEVTVRVNAYGPFDSLPAPSGSAGASTSQRPSDSPPRVATGTATVDRASTVTVTLDSPAPASGYYVYYAFVRESDQDPADWAMMSGPYFDQWAAPDENALARMQPVVATRVVDQVISKGSALVDTFTVSLADQADRWPAIKGTSTPVPVRVDVSVYGPLKSNPNPAGMVSSGSGGQVAVIPADAGAPLYTGSQTVSPAPGSRQASGQINLGVAPSSGYYVFVAHVLKANQGAYSDYFQHDAGHAYGLAEETTAARMRLDLRTDLHGAGEKTVSAGGDAQGRTDGLRIVEKGAAITDTLTVTSRTHPGQTGAQNAADLWLAPNGDPLRVDVDLALRGPVSRAQAVSGPASAQAQVPGVVAVAKQTITVNQWGSAGTSAHAKPYQVTWPEGVDASGCYYVTAEVSPTQRDARAEVFLEPGAAGRGAATPAWDVGEVFCTPNQMDVTTTVPAGNNNTTPSGKQNISKGDGFADMVHIARTNPADQWNAPGGAPVSIPMLAEVFGPFENKGVPDGPVLPDGEAWHSAGGRAATDPVATARFRADHYGDYPVHPGAPGVTVTGDWSASNSGWYFTRVSVDAAALGSGGAANATARLYLDDRYELGRGEDVGVHGPGTDGNWRPSETTVVRMEPVVSTTAARQVIDEQDLPQPLIDHVALALAHPLDKWLRVDGQPVQIDVDSRAYGPWDTPKQEAPNNQGDHAAHGAAGDPDNRTRFSSNIPGKAKPNSPEYVPAPGDLANPLHTSAVADEAGLDRELFDYPGKGADGAPAANVTHDGKETTAFTEPGTKSTGGETVLAKQEASVNALCADEQTALAVPACRRAMEEAPDRVTGFYTWTATIEPTLDTYDGFGSNWWIGQESATVRDRLIHRSEVKDTNLVPGGPIDDEITISGFRVTHTWPGDTSPSSPLFGTQGHDQVAWDADEMSARVVVYGPLGFDPSKSGTAEVARAVRDDDGAWVSPDGYPIHDLVLLPAQNTWASRFNPATGMWERKIALGSGVHKVKDVPYEPPADPETGQAMERAWYVVVYEFDGDTRTAPFSSGFDDEAEYAAVTWPETPPRFPALDVEKTGTGFVGEGRGNYYLPSELPAGQWTWEQIDDKPDNLNADGWDADTSETAAVVAPGVDTRVYFQVTNTGTEPLYDLVVDDATTAGGVSVGEIAWSVDPASYTRAAPLNPGVSFYGSAVLPAMAAGDVHADQVVVTGTGVTSGKTVGDMDEYHARAEHRAGIDIEKVSGGVPLPGAGNGTDEDNNATRVDGGASENPGAAVFDADTPETAVEVAADTATDVVLRVTNTGDEPLTGLRVADATTVGDVDVAIVWDHQADDDGVLLGADGGPLTLAPGGWFLGRGVLPALEAGSLHGDQATVTGRGWHTGNEVADSDSWHATVTTSPAVDVEKSHGQALAPGDGGGTDATDNRNAGGLDADTAATATQVDHGAVLDVFARITNTGDETLTGIRVADTMPDTGRPVPDVIGRSLGDTPVVWEAGGLCVGADVMGDDGTPTGLAVAGVTGDGFLTAAEGVLLELAPGQAFVCQGALSGLGEGEWHHDLFDVSATGKNSGGETSDSDDLWVHDPPLVSTTAVSVAPDGQETPVRGSDGSTVGVVGDRLRDRVEVTGQAPTGSHVIVALYRDDPGEAPTCAEDGNQPVWTSEPILVVPSGSHATALTDPVAQAGTFHFQETLFDTSGEVLAVGECGAPSETVHVLSVSTRAEVKADGLVADWNAAYTDVIDVEGVVPDGVVVSLASTAYKVAGGDVDWAASGLADPTAQTPFATPVALRRSAEANATVIATVPVAEEFSGPGAYRTEPLGIEDSGTAEIGAITWSETMTLTGSDNAGATRRVEGDFGDPQETVAPVNFGSKMATSPGSGAGGAATGADIAATAAVMVALIAVGALGLATTRSRRA